MDKFNEVMEKLWGIGDPISAMTKVLMNKYMEFSAARECVNTVYEKRGYRPAIDFVNMLSGYDLINIDQRSNIMEFIGILEEHKIDIKKQKNKMKKYKKVGTF